MVVQVDMHTLNTSCSSGTTGTSGSNGPRLTTKISQAMKQQMKGSADQKNKSLIKKQEKFKQSKRTQQKH